MLLVCIPFALFCHAEDGTQYAGLCTPALPLSHIPATAHDYDKEEFLVWFLLFGAFLSHQHLTERNKSHILHYLIST